MLPLIVKQPTRMQPSPLTALAAALVLGLTLSNNSRADVLFSQFPTTPIPDADPAGLTLDFGSAPAIEAVESITVTLGHEWLGDLTLTVVPPSGPQFILFDRVGVSAANPDGSSAIVGDFVVNDTNPVIISKPYQFAVTGADFALAAQNSPDVGIPTGIIYGAQTWVNGPIPAGAWKVFVADSAATSTGTIVSAEMTYTPLPEPSVFALILLSGLSAASLRFLPRRNLTKAARPGSA